MNDSPTMTMVAVGDAPRVARGNLRGLAELAFGSLTGVEASMHGPHLALLNAASLELDLNDPAQRRFGDYELLERLGEGGMGVVYRARHIPLDREVAVKLLSAGPWASREFIARFEREAQNAARMQHPNIVTVYEAGSHDGLHFMSMRLVEGCSLSALLKRGERFGCRQAAELIRTLAEAVAYAHSIGVLHLDLKPGNVLIDCAGVPCVADFGLARRLDNALATENDEISGTPSYMAPEQAQVRIQKLSAATDVWGLGAILYELLTGEPPFRADNAQATLKLVLEGTVRAPRRLQPSLPADLQAIVLHCLSRGQGDRYLSARALADDLARYVEGRPVRARPLNAAQRAMRWAHREPRLAATALLAVGLLVAGLAATTAQWRRADAGASAARDNLWATRAQSAQQALVMGRGFHSLRPLIANLTEMEAAGRDDEAGIERARIGTVLATSPRLVDMVQLPAGEQATSIAISPDARHFVVATIDYGQPRTRHVRQYEMATLRETWSTASDNLSFLFAGGDHGAEQAGLRYTADGRLVLVSMIEQPVVPAPRRSDMIAFDARNGHPVQPQGLPTRQADIVYDDAAAIALVRFRSDLSRRWPDSAQFYEVDGWKPIGSRHAATTSLAADLWLPAPHGDSWLGTRDSAQIAMYQVPSLKVRWRLELPQTSLVRAWQFSHDGKLIALGSVDGQVRLVDAADGRMRDLRTAPGARVQWVQFSADDRTLAAVDENGQLWAWDATTRASRSSPLQLFRGGVDVARIRYAGDTLFAGALHDGGDAELAYATLAARAWFNNMAVQGAARMQDLTSRGTAFDISLPAQRLVAANADGLIKIWRLPASPLLEPHAAPLPSDSLAFDGQRLVTVDGETVRVVDATSGLPLSPPLRHPENVRFAELSPDGSALVTIAGRTVRVIDPHTWQLRGQPIMLPATPERAVFAAAAPWLLLTADSYRGDSLRTHMFRIDLAHGVLREGPKLTSLTDLAMDATGGHAIVGTHDSVTGVFAGPSVVALADGAVSCSPELGEGWVAAMAADGRSAWFETPAGAGYVLQRWDLVRCRKLVVTAPSGLGGDGIMRALGGGVAVHRGGKQALLLVDADGRRQVALGDAIPAAMYDFALSDNGKRAAFATRNAVYLIDARHGRRLSAPLTAPIAGDDGIVQLAFSPDGTRLLARTVDGRWLLWRLPSTDLGAATLAQLARVLDPVPGDAVSAKQLADLRKSLRQRARSDASTPTPSRQTAPVIFVAAAGSGVDPRYVALDLRAAINQPLIGSVWSEPFARGDRPTLAAGRQRFLGVDYRIDGGVQLSGGGTATALGPELHHSTVVAVPDVVVRSVHVLVFMHIPMNSGEPPRTFGYVVLKDIAGHETRLEIRTVRDVVTDVAPKVAARGARVAFYGIPSSFVRRGGSMTSRSNVYAVTLEVPPGTGAIRGLRFDVPDGPMEAPLFFAATLETTPPGAGASKPH